MRVFETSPDGIRFKVSDEDATKIAPYRWQLVRCRSGRHYVSRSVRQGSKVERIYAAREITRAGRGQRVGFLNGDPLDLRRSNLAVLGASQSHSWPAPV